MGTYLAFWRALPYISDPCRPSYSRHVIQRPTGHLDSTGRDFDAAGRTVARAVARRVASRGQESTPAVGGRPRKRTCARNKNWRRCIPAGRQRHTRAGRTGAVVGTLSQFHRTTVETCSGRTDNGRARARSHAHSTACLGSFLGRDSVPTIIVSEYPRRGSEESLARRTGNRGTPACTADSGLNLARVDSNNPRLSVS